LVKIEGSCKQSSRALVWSLRNLQNFVYNSCLYEFEDIIHDVDEADVLSPVEYSPTGTFLKRVVENTTRYTKVSALANVNPYGSGIDLAYDYEIYFVTLDFPWSIASINLLKNWRKRCRIAVCYIVEIWNSDLEQLAHFKKFFSKFDLVCVGTYHVLEDVEKIMDAPCMFVLPGIDTLKFCPDFDKDRSLDIVSIGRRSPVTHKALVERSENESFFYYHELTNGSVLRIDNHQQHRTLTSNVLKSSRYFLTNYAKADLPDQILGEYEIGYRFFEGAAAGNVLIGAQPHGHLYERFFDWDDSIIPVNFDEPNINAIIDELDAQPERIERIGRNNVANSLLKHDWVYRWEQILNKLGVAATPALQARKSHLKQLAADIQPQEHVEEAVPVAASRVG